MVENNIGSSSDLTLFVVEESEKGVLTFPGVADIVVAAGDDASISQAAEFADSTEIFSTLDILDQFPNAIAPGEFNIPMYLRLDPTSKKIQGQALLKNSFGAVVEQNTATVTLGTNITNTGDQVNINFTCNKRIPDRFGIILFGAERMMYDRITWSNERTKTAGKFSIPFAMRGLGGTTIAAHTSGATGSVKSTFFHQKKNGVKTLSIWMVRDHVVLGMSGCMVTENSVNVNNEGAVMFTLSGNGMRLHWCGTMDSGTTDAAAAQIIVDDIAKVSPGVRIYNATKGLDNNGAGYTVTAINETTKTITIDPVMNVAIGDELKGFLPQTAIPIGTPVQSKFTNFVVGETSSKVRSTDISFSTPRPFFSDEVGTEYPEDFGFDKRSTTFTMNIYFRRDDAGWIQKGMSQNYFESYVTFGKDKEVYILLPRCSSGSPSITGDGPVMSMSTEVTAIGTVGEDSASMVVNI